MPTHLLSLPLEIRCQIFGYLLVSPSKYVTTLPPGPWLFSIMPWDLRQEITLESQSGGRSLDLSLLRVCKQLNEECKELLWGRNTVVYKPFEVSRHNERVSRGLGPIACARRLAVSMDMTIGGMDVWNVASALEAIGSWSKSGSLQEVTVMVLNERRKPFEERDPIVEREKGYRASLERLMKIRTGNSSEVIPRIPRLEAPQEWKRCFQEHLLTLCESRDGCLAQLKRKMVVNTNFGRLSAAGQRKYLRDSSMDPNDLMKELNLALGGELWIDGKVCFKDGQQIQDAFKICQEELDSGVTEVVRVHPVQIVQHRQLPKRKETLAAPRHDALAFTPWGQLLEERASVLDVVE